MNAVTVLDTFFKYYDNGTNTATAFIDRLFDSTHKDHIRKKNYRK